MKKLLQWIIVGLMISSTTLAQDKTSKVQVDRKVNLVQDEGKINLKVVENGKTVLDKSYSSMEEMKADPEAQVYNVQVGSPGKTLVFKDKDGNITKMGEEATNVWVTDDDIEVDLDSDFDPDINFAFENSDAGLIKIRKDENGNMVIEKDGEPMDVDHFDSKRLKIKKLDDGRYEVEDEHGVRIMDADEMKFGNTVFFSEGGVFEEGGNNVFRFKDGSDGEAVIELKGDGTWVSDSLHAGEHNVMVFGDSEDIEVDSDGEHKKIIIKEQRVDGLDGQVVRVLIEKLHIEISDIEELSTIEEIPGSNVLSNKMLELDEVNYYPNPNNGTFNLSFASDQKPTQVRIIDMMGKEVYFENLKDFNGRYDKRIDLSQNEKGMYILQILQGKRSWNKKLVIE